LKFGGGAVEILRDVRPVDHGTVRERFNVPLGWSRNDIDCRLARW
jgi:hypothetical protein